MSLLSLNRRQALKVSACGFGNLALSGLLNSKVTAAPANPLSARKPHFTPRAKRVIFLFMQGGVSHVDSFDYKPLLAKKNGQTLAFDDARVIANTGKRGSSQKIMKELWKFRQHGQSGRWASELFPEMAQHVDKMCMLHSMHTEGVAHGPATLFLHTGATNFVRPSMGSWINYGLGSESDDLPGFISICPSPGNGGARNYGTAFLPPVYQGTPIGSAGKPAANTTIRDLVNGRYELSQQREQFELLRSLNAEQLKRNPDDANLYSVVSSLELAWRMQNNAPGVLDF